MGLIKTKVSTIIPFNTVSATPPSGGGWVATEALITLYSGEYILYATVSQGSSPFTQDLAVTLAVNNNNDSSGSLLPGVSWNTFAGDAEGGPHIGFQRSLEPVRLTIEIGDSKTIYGKIYASPGNNVQSTVIRGFALRIA